MPRPSHLRKPSKLSIKRFNPNSNTYDYASARKAGLRADAEGHWPSRDPKSGLILKGRKHRTYAKTVAGEKKAGYEIYKGKDGRDYSRKKK
jgi:hypothetical protein